MANLDNYHTLLSFDFGTKRIGVAIGQTITGTATPLPPLKAREGIPDWQILQALLDQWKPDAIVVGIPLNMDGSEQFITHKARNFAQEIRARYKIEVFEVDERLTTKEARQKLFELGGFRALEEISIDSFAAKIILESWFRK